MAVFREMRKTLTYDVSSVGGAFDQFKLLVTDRTVVLEKGGPRPLKMAGGPGDIRRTLQDYREVFNEIEREINERFPLPPDVIDVEGTMVLPNGVTVPEPSSEWGG